jgi:hypothetical protein
MKSFVYFLYLFVVANSIASTLKLTDPVTAFKKMRFLTNEELLISPGRSTYPLMEGMVPTSPTEGKEIKCSLFLYNPNSCPLLVEAGTTFYADINSETNQNLKLILKITKENRGHLKTVSPFGACNDQKKGEKLPAIEIRCRHATVKRQVPGKTDESNEGQLVEYSSKELTLSDLYFHLSGFQIVSIIKK